MGAGPRRGKDLSIRCIVTDLDGTVLPESGIISDRVKDAFDRAAAKGVSTVIATGRADYESLYPETRLGNVTHKIMLAGCSVCDLREGRKQIFTQALDKEDAKKVISTAEGIDGLFCEIFTEGRSVLSRKSYEITKDYTANPSYLEILYANMKMVEDSVGYVIGNSIPVMKVFAMSVEKGPADILEQKLRGIQGINMLMCINYGYDIIPKTADKGRALRAVIGSLGLRQEEVMVCGDSMNDIDMFLPDTFNVCVEDGFEAVKKAADYIAPSCAEDGVAEAIERFVLR